MKAVVFLCIFVVVGLEANTLSLSETQKQKAASHTSECTKETGVKVETLADAKKGQFSDDESLKKFILCFFQKAGIVTADGNLNTDVALAKLPPGVDKVAASKVLNDCKTKKGSSPAETAFEIFKCYYTNTKQHIVLD